MAGSTCLIVYKRGKSTTFFVNEQEYTKKSHTDFRPYGYVCAFSPIGDSAEKGRKPWLYSHLFRMVILSL